MVESTTRKFMEQCDELMKCYMQSSGFDMIETLADMDSNELKTTQLACKMYFTAKKLSMEQARAMDRLEVIESKLDMLLNQ